VNDEQFRRLERQARANGLEPRDAAALYLGIERNRYVLTVFAANGPISLDSRRAVILTHFARQEKAFEQMVWLTPIETVEEITRNGWFFEAAQIVDVVASRIVPSGERVEIQEGWD
jgi:hypothetical protein